MPRPPDPDNEARRRAQVLDTVVRLLAEDAYGSVSLSRVAREAGVSKGLVTYYFTSKDALIVAAIERYHAQQAELLQSLVDSPLPARDRLRALVTAALPSQPSVEQEVRFQVEAWSFAKTNEAARAAIAASYRRFRRACEALLERGVEEGVVSPERRAWVYPFIHALIDGLSFQVAADPEADVAGLREGLEALIEELVV